MKLSNFFVILTVLGLATHAIASDYTLQNFKGSVEIRGGSEELKKLLPLRAGLEIRSGKDSLVRIEGKSGDIIILQADSRLSVDKDSLVLKEGSLRWVNPTKKSEKIQTPISEHELNSGDAHLTYLGLYGRTLMQLYKGELQSRLLGDDQTKILAADQFQQIQALVDEEGPIVDVFLGGRKRVRGDFEESRALNAEEKKVVVASMLEPWVPPRKPASIGPTSEQICTKPFAEYNQCLWTCVGMKKGDKGCITSRAGVHCQRKRCNANGEWVEETRMPALSGHHCQGAKPVVAPCNY